MKKVVRMLGLCALVALAFTSCKKNETNGTVTFKATISQPATDGRTHLDNINVFGWKGLFWNADDQIKLFNKTKAENNNENYTVQSIVNQVATFEGNADFLSTITNPNDYIAFYPNAQVTADGIELVISNQQNWANGSFEDDVYPMYGFNDENGNIQFHSDAGVLYLNFKLDPQYYNPEHPDVEVTRALDEIIVTGKNATDVAAGTMVYDLDGNYTMKNTFNFVKFNCNGLNLSSITRQEFLIVLPEGAFPNGFTVEIKTLDGTTMTLDGTGTITEETMTWMGQLDLPAGL